MGYDTFSSFDNLDLDKMKLLWDDPFSSFDYTSMLGQLLLVCFTEVVPLYCIIAMKIKITKLSFSAATGCLHAAKK